MKFQPVNGNSWDQLKAKLGARQAKRAVKAQRLLLKLPSDELDRLKRAALHESEGVWRSTGKAAMVRRLLKAK